ncbi:MAG TPA: SMR family transporter [Candidatus Binataceae bacterium]|nr:SMR family transporter [Candidatus Binataceae bacterium]
MNFAFAQLITAAMVYALGGLCMKLSDGLSRPLPTALLFILFALGAGLQALGMRRADLGVAYILVLGLEAVAALALSVFVLGESCSPSRLGAVAMVIIGILWLRRT